MRELGADKMLDLNAGLDFGDLESSLELPSHEAVSWIGSYPHHPSWAARRATGGRGLLDTHCCGAV
jgi:hypothetical protein